MLQIKLKINFYMKKAVKNWTISLGRLNYSRLMFVKSYPVMGIKNADQYRAYHKSRIWLGSVRMQCDMIDNRTRIQKMSAKRDFP